jgi:hypothetical protein
MRNDVRSVIVALQPRLMRGQFEGEAWGWGLVWLHQRSWHHRGMDAQMDA